MNPRILFVDHTAVLGGSELYLLDLARRFRDRSVVLLFQNGPLVDKLRASDVEVRILEAQDSFRAVTRKGDWLQSLRALVGVINLVRRVARMGRDYDVLYANSQKALIAVAPAGLLSRRPVIWNLHDILIPQHFSHFHRKLVVWIANRMVDRVIVNSDATRLAFIESGGVADKVHIVYNGIDDSRFELIAHEEVDACRRELGIQGVPSVGVFSRLAPWKGQHVMVRALARTSQFHALFVGDALFPSDGPYVAELQSEIQRLGLVDRVHFLGFRSDVPKLMKSVDVIAHTSVSPEPFGRVIVEGMLAAKPVVATRMGGALEIIENGRTGVLIPADDPSELASTLDRLVSDSEGSREMAERGREVASVRFSMQTFFESIERHVREAGVSR